MIYSLLLGFISCSWCIWNLWVNYQFINFFFNSWLAIDLIFTALYIFLLSFNFLLWFSLHIFKLHVFFWSFRNLRLAVSHFPALYLFVFFHLLFLLSPLLTGIASFYLIFLKLRIVNTWFPCFAIILLSSICFS